MTATTYLAAREAARNFRAIYRMTGRSNWNALRRTMVETALNVRREMRAIRAPRIAEPKFAPGDVVRGRHFGEFVIVGREYCANPGVAEWLYSVFEVRNGERITGEMRLVESCFE